ncbi:DUF6053 domain-containing protein [Lysobacter enzymogenes]|uniref:DUF6053 domain-containing protein n=1 Tax=Lysobacter enzymogenes TaxID=69 RepID=UPI003CCD0FB4
MAHQCRRARKRRLPRRRRGAVAQLRSRSGAAGLRSDAAVRRAAIGAESVGPEGPPTRADAPVSRPALMQRPTWEVAVLWEGLQARRLALRRDRPHHPTRTDLPALAAIAAHTPP